MQLFYKQLAQAEGYKSFQKPTSCLYRRLHLNPNSGLVLIHFGLFTENKSMLYNKLCDKKHPFRYL